MLERELDLGLIAPNSLLLLLLQLPPSMIGCSRLLLLCLLLPLCQFLLLLQNNLLFILQLLFQ